MKTSTSEMSAGTIVPPVHLEFIQNQLENPAACSVAEVEQYHRALFLHHHAVEWEKHRHQAKTHEQRLAYLESQLKQTDLELAGRNKLVPVTLEGVEDVRPTSPWNGFDAATFGLCALAILCLIGFGVWNISFNLLESGLVTFRENPWRAYLWAALLPVGALAVKLGWDFLEERGKRSVYLWICLAAGLIGVLVWVGAYACVYPTLSKGVNEHIAALSVFDSPSSVSGLNFSGAKWVDVITVAAQATAEIFLSAVLGIYLTMLYARHRPVRLAADPAFVQLSHERLRLEESIERERTGLGEAAGHLARLENQLEALLAYGKSLFHRETARQQNQSEKRQVILDQLSEHLRQHLETGDSPNRLASSAAPGAGSSYRKNGD